jgi:thioredoxin 1
MGKNTTDLNEKKFDDFVKKGKSVVDFWAEWCGPCRIIGSIVEEVANEMKGKVKFAKVDVDGNQDLAQRFDVMSIPTLIFFKDGQQVNRIVGVIDKKGLVDRIREIK